MPFSSTHLYTVAASASEQASEIKVNSSVRIMIQHTPERRRGTKAGNGIA